jgi:malate dehydrogenase (oxaloacetate-decarboxylating)
MLNYSRRTDPFTGEEYIEVPFKGLFLTDHPMYNKGTAFSQHERQEFNLEGLFPKAISDIELQKKKTYESFCAKPNDLEKYIYMLALQDRNETLHYALVLNHLTEMLPIIYTPTVGQACQGFSHLFRRRRGLYVTAENIHNIDKVLSNVPFSNISLIVASDGERILGLGDQGAGGMGIPIGKISLYVAASGIHPAYCLPILIDVGTNNEQLLKDPLYIGIRKNRLTGDAYDEIIEKFVNGVRRRFPQALLQWEDIGKNNAFRLLERFRERILSFNDDIQGTGSIAMAVFLSAMKVKKQKLSDQRFVVFGQGQAGIGIARTIITGLKVEGLSESEARARIFGIDKDGLLMEGMPVTEEQKPVVKDKARVANWKLSNPNKIELLDTILNAKATVLVGVTAQSGSFTDEIIAQMVKNGDLPLIMPISNPTAKAEATPENIYKVTKGNGLVATGSPFKPVKVNGKERVIPQCNNLYIFPGVGLGALVSGTPKITDEMFMAAAKAVSDMVTEKELKSSQLLPDIEEIREVSAQAALAVAKEARDSGLGVIATDEELLTMIRKAMWQPRYLPLRYVKPEPFF